MDTFSLVFALLVIYQLKHFIADFPLQGEYMLGKFKAGWDFFPHLMAHVSLHGGLTFAIAVVVKPEWALQLALLDMTIHFFMDRIKAGPKYLGRFKALTAKEWVGSTKEQKQGNTLFWWSLGFDQMVHHLTHYLIIYFLVS